MYHKERNDFNQYHTIKAETYYENSDQFNHGSDENDLVLDEGNYVLPDQNVSVQQKDEKKSSFIGIFIAVWFIGSIIYMAVISNHQDIYKTEKICLCAGQLFLVLGVIFLISALMKKVKMSKSTYQKTTIGMPILCVLIGIGLVIFSGIRIWGNTSEKETLEMAVPHILVWLFIIVGIGMLSQAIFQLHEKKQRCTIPVNVTCDMVKKKIAHDGENRTRVYSPVWKGYLSGSYRIFECSTYTNRRYHEGQMETILVNPSDFAEYIDTMDRSSKKIQIILGCVFTIVGVVAEYSLLMG